MVHDPSVALSSSPFLETTIPNLEFFIPMNALIHLFLTHICTHKLHSIVLHIFSLYINRTVWSLATFLLKAVLFWDLSKWLRFIHFHRGKYFDMKITVFLYSLEEYLACFPFFTIVDNTVWTIFFYMSPGKCAWISVMLGWKCSLKQLVQFIFPPRMYENFYFFTSSPHLVLSHLLTFASKMDTQLCFAMDLIFISLTEVECFYMFIGHLLLFLWIAFLCCLLIPQFSSLSFS